MVSLIKLRVFRESWKMDVAVIGWIRQGEMMQGHLCDESVKVSTLVHKVPFRDALMDCCTSNRGGASECVVEVHLVQVNVWDGKWSGDQ